MTETIKDIPYASQSPAQKLDIYLPDAGAGLYPVVVYLHPGGFTMGTKDMIKPFISAITGRGYAAVSINYRLADEAQFPAQIYDAKAAVRWLRANAAKYRFNPEKIAIWGVSAGATLAALLGTSAGVKELEDLSMGNPIESSRVIAVIDWYGPVDFITLNAQRAQSGVKPPPAGEERTGESKLFGGTYSEIPEKYKAASAATHINKECAPFYIQHGTADDVVPTQQSIMFAGALEKAIGKDKVQLRLIPGAGHFDKVQSSEENVKASLDFVDSYLK